MKEVASFIKLSFDDFKETLPTIKNTCSKQLWTDDELRELYDRWVSLPERERAYYKIRTPISFALPPGDKKVVPIGVECDFIEEDEYVLNLYQYRIPNEPFRNINFSAYYIVPFFDNYYKGNLNILVENHSNNRITFESGDVLCVGVFTKIGHIF